MRIFIDTSAFLAILDGGDSHHRRAKKRWADLVTSEAVLFCSNYILIETVALVQNRLGMEAVKVFNDDMLPLVEVDFVDSSVHHAGVNALLTASRKKLSLVDCVSFETMRRLELDTAFTFDRHFAEQGFVCIP